MAQKIIDLDAAVPSSMGVRINGKVYEVPGDIPIPQFLEIERLTRALDSPEEGEGGRTLEQLYEVVLDLFREKDPDIEDLPIGPHRLGALVVQLYSGAADADAGDEGDGDRPTRPRRSGTRSTSKARRKRSRGSK